MATATAAVGVAGGVAKFFEGRAMQKKAQSLINNFEWQELTNPYENQQVSTLGTDLRAEQANITTAGNVEALRSGGNRALVGGLGRVQAQNNTVSREMATTLDEQQKQIDFAKSGQDVRNQSIIEKRQTDELAGFGQMINTGLGIKHQGFDTALAGMGLFGQTKLGTSIDGGMANKGGNSFEGYDKKALEEALGGNSLSDFKYATK